MLNINLNGMKVQMSSMSRSDGDGMESAQTAEELKHPAVVVVKNPTEPIREQPRKLGTKLINTVTLLPDSSPVEKQIASALKRKEPKFVPYEPYKAAINPIVQQDFGNNIKGPTCRKSYPGQPLASPPPNAKIVHVTHDDEPASELIGQKDELILWAKEKEAMLQEMQRVKLEKHDLEKQIKVQVQINAELKKLLVASVGEDLQTRVQFLTEDKTRLAHDIVNYSQKLVEDSEKLEKISIQCDIWRSKFLASSLMVDELAKWKACLCHEVEEAKECLKILLDEQDQSSLLLISTYKTLKSIYSTLFHMEPPNLPKKPIDQLELSLYIKNLVEGIEKKLQSSIDHKSSHDMHLMLTSGQLLAIEVLQKPHLFHILNGDHVKYPNLFGGLHNLISQRLHPNTRYDQITFYCCGHCKGEIKLV